MKQEQRFRPHYGRPRYILGFCLATVALTGIRSVAVGQLPTGAATTDWKQDKSSVSIDTPTNRSRNQAEPLSRPIGSDATSSFGSGSRRPSDTAATPLLREGTRIRDQLGHFIHLTSDSAVFVDQQGRQFSALKNLNLQRVMHMPRSTRAPEKVRWSVSGMVTEFNGKNYLLITRAVRKSVATAPRQDAAGHRTPLEPAQ